jgi:hypothetical protein
VPVPGAPNHLLSYLLLRVHVLGIFNTYVPLWYWIEDRHQANIVKASSLVDMPLTRAQSKRAREEDEEICRVCLQGENKGPLVQLCGCRGSARLVHRHCIDKWRRMNPKTKAAYICGECRVRYNDELSLELLHARLKEQRAAGRKIGFILDALAKEMQLKGDLVAAEKLFREAMEFQRHRYGDLHQQTLASTANLSQLLLIMGKRDAVELLCRETLHATRLVFDRQHPRTLTCMNSLGLLLKHLRRIGAPRGALL